MSQFLQQQTQQAASPVTPGGAQSPGSPGGHKVTRPEAKKIFTEEVNTLIEAVKLISVYSDALSNLPKGQKLEVGYTNQQGQRQSYQIGRQEFNQFKGQIVARMKALPKLAFILNKTRRKVAPNSGFKAPARFKQPIVDFFRQANIGPQVNGEFVLGTDNGQNIKNVPNSKTLQVQQGTNLNDLLYFIQPQVSGQQNPLYRIVAPGTLTPLFALHAYYENMQIPGEATRLSASQQMRNTLGGLMEDTIRNDIATVINNNPQVRQQAEQLQQQLIQAINNPNMLTQDGDSTIAGIEVFNPNRFLYAHFSKLISNSKVTNEDPSAGPTKLTDDELNQLRSQIAQTYQNVPALGDDINNFSQTYQQNVQKGIQPPVQQGQQLPYEQVVLSDQQDNVALSRAYKNQIKQKADRERRKREKQAQQTGVGQGLPGGQQGGFQFDQFGGLPGGGQQFGGLPSLGRQ